MIIKKLDIEGFGKFSGRSLSFGKGFNLIYGNNEDGKTTLMSFIKLMFFGSCGSKSADVSKNLRKKYKPWSSAPMSGAIEFETEGNLLRIHKEFNKSAATDKTTLFVPDTGEKTILPPSEDAGLQFFGMSSDEFERSIFVDGFGGFSPDSSGDSLAVRIANLSSTGDENHSQSKIRARLASAKESLVSKSGKKGVLAEEKDNYEKLLAKLEDCREKQKAQAALRSAISELKSEITNFEDAVLAFEKAEKYEQAEKELSQLTVLHDYLKHHKELVEQMKQKGFDCLALKKPVATAKVLYKAIPEVSECETIGITTEDYENVFRLKESLTQLEKDRALLSEKIAEAFKSAPKELSKTTLVFSIFAGISALSSLVLFYFNKTAGIAGIILSLVFLLLALLNRKKTKVSDNTLYKAELQKLSFFENELFSLTPENIQELFEKKYSECESALLSGLTKYGCANFQEFSKKATESFGQEQLRQNAEAARKSFVDSVAAFVDGVNSFEEAEDIWQKLDSALSSLDALEHNAQLVASAIGIDRPEINDISERISKLREYTANTEKADFSPTDITKLRTDLSQKRRELEELQGKLHNPEISESDLIIQISEKKERLDRLTEKYEAISLAAEAMDEAITEMNRGLGFQLSQKTGEYLSRMSNGKYSEVLVARDLSIEARSSLEEGYHEWKYLSSGAIDRAYLALRLAATDILASKHNPLPLFLDDVLAQYDDESCRSTLVFLKHYLENSGSVSQIFLFTCHKHIENMAKEIFSDLVEVRL
ncbi:MAG: AAA family ATPase [Clostridia bacterium]|nr:AAA family ATPase [Clostridia bacterium]